MPYHMPSVWKSGHWKRRIALDCFVLQGEAHVADSFD
jgi:hypothetical protein